jgi:HEAT repeat protein
LLEAKLEKADPITRNAILGALKTWGDQKTVPLLIPRLKKFDPGAQCLVMDALVAIGDEGAVELIAGQLAAPAVREHAGKCLIAMGPKVETKVIPYLDHFAGDVNRAARCEVCNVLGAIGSEMSIPFLERAAMDRLVAGAAREALQAIDRRHQ